jgi:hypothetical protein
MAKEYEMNGETPEKEVVDAAEESDDSATKRSEFVAPSPEGNASQLRAFITTKLALSG